MKIATTIVRILLGLLLLFSSLAYFFKLMPQSELSNNGQLFITGIFATGYLMPLVKITELLVAIALLVNRLTAVALVVLFPVSLNIFLFHAILEPAGTPVSVFILLANFFLLFVQLDKFKPILTLK